MLKVAQTKTETWKVVVSSMTAGGAIVVALVALLRFAKLVRMHR